MKEQSQQSIACSIIRGGTSRAAYFLGHDLPSDASSRNRILLKVMGGPDALQVDGIGGGHPLTSKVAVVAKSTRDDADVDYLFLQVSPTGQTISDAQNCGNILAGVGHFAIERGLVAAQDGETRIRVHMVNSGNLCELLVATPNGLVDVEGDTKIDGVPGTGAAVTCNFLDIAGSASGALLPTGNVIDEINGIKLTCIDNGMPVVVMRASDVGVTGGETPEELEANTGLRERVEAIRLQAGPLMNLGDVKDKSVPKMCLVSASKAGGLIDTRTFIPHACHRAIGVLGAVSVATACLIPHTVCAALVDIPGGANKVLDVEHPSGSFRVSLSVDEAAAPENIVRKAGVIRTARTIMRGEILVPNSIDLKR